MEILPIAVVEKTIVARMGIVDFTRMFDGAEILFGTRDDFADVGQMLVIVHDVVGPLHLRDGIDREAELLVQADTQVEQ
jgi:hypothetical protein